jgi:hypothetical protein
MIREEKQEVLTIDAKDQRVGLFVEPPNAKLKISATGATEMTRDELEQLIYERTRNFVDGRVMDCILELIAEEREACAKVCEDIDTEYEGEDVLATWCAAAIRARGEQEQPR